MKVKMLKTFEGLDIVNNTQRKKREEFGDYALF